MAANSTSGVSTQPSSSLSSHSANTEATCWNWASVVEETLKTGTPNTVVYFGKLEKGLVFRVQVTLSTDVEMKDNNYKI